MFGIGFQEMLIILVVVLVLFGPKRLPDLARSLGKGIAEFKKASEEVRQGINEAMKEEPSKEDASPAKTDPPPGASPSALPSPVDAAATVPTPGETSPPSAASGQS
jgi:TatA/E family protein of Tat protein translocase